MKKNLTIYGLYGKIQVFKVLTLKDLEIKL